MENNLSNLMIGVISGIFSSIIIWGFVLIIKGIIQPSIQKMLYRGIDLEGEWHNNLYTEKKTNIDGKETVSKIKVKEITMTINQNAYEIKGDLIIKNIRTSGEVFSFYKYTGYTRDNYVIINYSPKSKKFIGLGTLVLIIKNGGKCLCGDLIGTALNDMNLTHIDGIKLDRK